MRASVSIVAAILGAAPLAAASSQGESLQAARIAKDAFYRCAQMTVAQYDDRISPANIVAKAIAAKCRSWVDAMVKNTNRTEATNLFDEVMRGDEGNLLGIVLHHRVLNSTPPPLVASRAPPGQSALSSQAKAALKR